MTGREKLVIRQSFALVRELAGPLSLLFYGRLFELDPALRPMFRGDIALQGVKLMEMLTAVVENLDRTEDLTPVLHAMGHRHAGYGVLPHHYELVAKALLWSLGQALQADFDAETRAAWGGVIGTVSAVMQDGAKLAPPAPDV